LFSFLVFFCIVLLPATATERINDDDDDDDDDVILNVPKCSLDLLKYYSVTNMLLLTGLPSFDTLMINSRKSDAARWNVNSNVLVESLLVV